MKLNEIKDKKITESVDIARAAHKKAKELTQQGHDAERMGDEKAMRRNFADAAKEKLKIRDAMKTKKVNEISDKTALSYAKQVGPSQDKLDVTTDAGFRKFHNRQHGHALALDKMHQPHRRLKAKVGTTDANAKDAAYRKAIGEEGNEEGLPNKSEWEYDKEGDMAKDQIHTIIRHAEELEHALGDDENLPEWVQEKLAQIKGMMVSVGDYMLTQHERGDEKRSGREGIHGIDDMEEGNEFSGALAKAKAAHQDTFKVAGKTYTVKEAESKKTKRMIKHIEKSEKETGKSKDVAKKIAYATANKRGMLDNKNKKKKIKEAHMVTMHVEDNHEVSMAQGDLYELAKKSIALHQMLDHVDQLEGWVQAKITLAADYISTVHDYLDHGLAMQHGDIEEPMHEAVIVPTGTTTDKNKLPPQTKQMVQKVSQGLNKMQNSVMTDKDGNVSVVNKKDTPKMAQAGMMTVDEADIDETSFADAGDIAGGIAGGAAGAYFGKSANAALAGSALGAAAGTAAGKWVDKKLGLGEQPRKSVDEEAAEIAKRMFGEKDNEGQGWGSSDTSAAINVMKDHIRSVHGGRYNPDTIEDAAMSAAETYHDMMGYDNVEDAADALVGHFVRRWMSGSLRAD